MNNELGITSAIDVGSPAIDRATTSGSLATYINLTNPADRSGIITSIEIWANTNMTGLRVGTFYLVSGTTYKCRASVAIGNVTAGSKQTFAVSLAVQTGDFIGAYWATGTIERDASGGAGMMYVAGEYIDPDDVISYSLFADFALSLYGSKPNGQDFFIDYMEHDISMSGLLHTAVYRLADCINEDFWNLGYSKLGTQTKLGY